MKLLLKCMPQITIVSFFQFPSGFNSIIMILYLSIMNIFLISSFQFTMYLVVFLLNNYINIYNSLFTNKSVSQLNFLIHNYVQRTMVIFTCIFTPQPLATRGIAGSMTGGRMGGQAIRGAVSRLAKTWNLSSQCKLETFRTPLRRRIQKMHTFWLASYTSHDRIHPIFNKRGMPSWLLKTSWSSKEGVLCILEIITK